MVGRWTNRSAANRNNAGFGDDGRKCSLRPYAVGPIGLGQQSLRSRKGPDARGIHQAHGDPGRPKGLQ